MKLYIKHMVSNRCILTVEEELKKAGIEYNSVELGIADVEEPPTAVQIEYLREQLEMVGLVLLEDKKSNLVEKIKNTVIEMVHHSDELPKVNHSDYLKEKIGYDYTYLSTVFSEARGMTIQHFIILHKIEKVKDLLLYTDMSLSEISFKMHYSSVAHLSTQFKKITGLTPTYYKELKLMRETAFENV
ncbi:MAG TPA: AraC family transcriptional regulator [Cytophagales bacterium]|nr:AraC family transcriptional regulator [Cytophagales bacterium]